MTPILYGLILVVHILVSFVLIVVILLQGGRGGLSEALGGAAAQSLFGGGAKTVLTKATAVCAGLFVVTCLSLAYLSTVQGRSVLEQIPLPQAEPPAPSDTSPSQ
ncbi:MAG: preprotein translocase subunit SecG [Candidatus Omnitrophica bacterium]|nr:preprotein translocase subunit SecG [Candidatus Omnitrophota bacterium]